MASAVYLVFVFVCVCCIFLSRVDGRPLRVSVVSVGFCVGIPVAGTEAYCRFRYSMCWWGPEWTHIWWLVYLLIAPPCCCFFVSCLSFSRFLSSPVFLFCLCASKTSAPSGHAFAVFNMYYSYTFLRERERERERERVVDIF
jgi:hypothetical protein